MSDSNGNVATVLPSCKRGARCNCIRPVAGRPRRTERKAGRERSGRAAERFAERAESLQLQRPACHPRRRPRRRRRHCHRRRRRCSGINVSRADTARGGAKRRDAARRGANSHALRKGRSPGAYYTMPRRAVIVAGIADAAACRARPSSFIRTR